MDWFDQDQEENIFNQERDSFSQENVFDIENLFVKKQNGFDDDYEVRMEEFMVDGCDQGCSNATLQKKGSREMNSDVKVNKVEKVTNGKFFAVKREGQSTTSVDENQQEGLSVDGCSSLINYSGDVNNLNVEDAVRKNLLAPNTILNNSLYYNMAICNGSSPCPFNYYISLHDLPLSERMKIKKEKTKLLLERKTKRENFEPTKGEVFEKYLILKKEDREEELKINTNSINESPNNSLISPKSRSLKSSYSKSTGMNSNSQPKNENLATNNSLSGDDSSNNSNHNNIVNSQLSKKEMKMLRNRISAQRSRDRKKKELDDIKVISQDLLNQNCNLKKELESKEKELINLKEKLNKLCQNCQLFFSNNVINSNNNCSNNNTQRYTIVDSSRGNFSSGLKYSIMAGLLVIVCLVGVFSFSTNENMIKDFKGRILTSAEEEVFVEGQKKKDQLVDETSSSLSNGKSLVLYNKKKDRGSKDSPQIVSSENKIFSISKNIEKYIKRKTKSMENSNQIDSYNDLLDIDIGTNEDHQLASTFLSKKRNEFLFKMGKRKSEVQEGFLKKTNQMCVNVDGLDWSVQKEIKLHDDDMENEIRNYKEEKSGIVLKKSDKLSDSLLNMENKNQVVPFKDGSKKFYQYENSIMQDNIKSMYCRDFITPSEDNTRMFKKLFNKINMDYEKESGYKTKDEDCLYLHMIVPSTENFETGKSTSKEEDFDFTFTNSKDSASQGQDQTLHNFSENEVGMEETNRSNTSDDLPEKKVYYEVGCKIFEINKIYK